MTRWEYAEHQIPHGPNRDRAFVLQGLNDLGAQGWQVIGLKENHLFFRAGPDGKQVPVDGIRVLCQRPVTEGGHECAKKLRKE